MKIKYILISLGALLVVAIIALLLFGEKWAEQKIESKIADVENLSYDSLDIKIAEESIVFKGVKFTPDNTSLKAHSLTIQGIDIYRLILTNEVILKQVMIDSLLIDHYLTQDSTKTSKKKSINAKVAIENIDLKNGFIQLFQQDSSFTLSSYFEVSATSIELDKIKEPKQLLQRISTFRSDSFKYITKDSLYTMGTKQVLYKADGQALLADSVYVTCNYSKYEFGRVVGHEKDWIDFNIDSVAIAVPALEELIVNNNASTITLYHPELNVFLDKRLPFPEGKSPKLLREQLAEEGLSMGIDSIILVDADIVYEEYVKKGEGPGRVSFNNLNGHVSNMYSFNRKHNKPPHLVASCDLLNTTKLYADISFPLSKTEKTLVKGKLESMDLKAFNAMMKYVAFTEIEEGQLHNMDFEFTYDQKKSDGTMNFEYDNLKIDFLNKDDAETGGFFNEVKGFLANTFVVNKKNTYDSGKFRIGEIGYERNMEKSMFNFWWKSILSGVQSSTGIKRSKEKIDTN